MYTKKFYISNASVFQIRLYRKLHNLVSCKNAWQGTLIVRKKACQTSSKSICNCW